MQHTKSRHARAFPARALLVVTLALGLCSPHALAATSRSDKAGQRAGTPKDNRVWLLARADETIALRFGPPGAADPVFAVSCQPGAGLMQFTVEVASPKIRSGEGVALTLAAGKRRLELAASTFRGATDGVVVAEAAVSLDPRVLDLFADGDTLTVRAPGATASFPLAGARTKLADFRKACQARR